MLDNLDNVLKYIGPGDAFINVDPENDFFPGGSLGVPHGDEIIDPINRVMARFEKAGLPIIITKDWHPPVTKHFAKYGGDWPEHCVQNTWGAELHPGLIIPESAIFLLKGLGDENDYSGFHARDASGTTLEEILHNLGVRRIFVGGLAEDVCVKDTALVGREKKFEVVLLRAATRPVNIHPDDGAKAVAEMKSAGVQVYE